MSDRIARAFNRSGVTCTVVLDILKSFNRVWHAGLLHRLKPYRISGQISSFLSYRWLLVVLDRKSSQEYPVNAGGPQLNAKVNAPFLVLHVSYYTLMALLMRLSVILLSMLMNWTFNLNLT